MSLTHQPRTRTTAGCAVFTLLTCPRAQVACLLAGRRSPHSPWPASEQHNTAAISSATHPPTPTAPPHPPLHHAPTPVNHALLVVKPAQRIHNSPPSFLPRALYRSSPTPHYFWLSVAAHLNPLPVSDPTLDRVRDRHHPSATTTASASVVDSVPGLLMSALAWRSPRKKTSATPT